MKITAEIVNGKITYLPHITRPEDMNVFVKEWSE